MAANLRLKREVVNEMVRRVKAGDTVTAIAMDLNCCRRTVYYWCDDLLKARRIVRRTPEYRRARDRERWKRRSAKCGVPATTGP